MRTAAPEGWGRREGEGEQNRRALVRGRCTSINHKSIPHAHVHVHIHVHGYVYWMNV